MIIILRYIISKKDHLVLLLLIQKTTTLVLNVTTLRDGQVLQLWVLSYDVSGESF